MLKISELAGRIGLSAHTIRFYEKHGLIEASERSESGYRLYSAADVNRKMAELEAMQKVLSRLLDNCDGGLENATHCSILEVLDNGGLATTGRVN